jgi:hypothetical protein
MLSLLVARCLERDPLRRITARAALDHGFLLAPAAADASTRDAARRQALAQWCAHAHAARDGGGDSAGAGGRRALPQRGLEGLERSIEGLLSFFARAPSA